MVLSPPPVPEEAGLQAVTAQVIWAQTEQDPPAHPQAEAAMRAAAYRQALPAAEQAAMAQNTRRQTAVVAGAEATRDHLPAG